MAPISCTGVSERHLAAKICLQAAFRGSLVIGRTDSVVVRQGRLYLVTARVFDFSRAISAYQ